MNFKHFNSSYKASKKIDFAQDHPKLFLKDHDQKMVPPFTKDWKMCTSGLSFHERVGRKNSEKKVYRPSLDILGVLSCEMSYASILRNLYFQVTRLCAGPGRVRCFLQMCHVSKSLFPGV